MKQVRSTLPKSLRTLSLAFAMLSSMVLTPAFADEYGDVNQLLRSGKLPEALAKAEQYLQAKPRDPQMRFVKGVIQSESGKPFDAIATFTKLTEEYPELPEPYNNLAVLYAGQNQLDKARTALEMAIRTNPSYTTAHENLGDVYAKLASQAYSKALQLDANNSGIQPKLALIRELFAPAPKGQKPSITPTTSPASSPAAPATSTSTSPAATPSGTSSASATKASLPPAPIATPVAPATAPGTAPAATGPAASRDVERAVNAWAAAWAAKDMGAYLGAYGRDFDPPGKLSRAAWEEERRQRILSKSRISVKLSDVSISVKGNTASAKFRQDYVANELSANSRKTLDLVKSGERWLIVREQAGS
jgi:tetratricopeptide (TPR) repeat protein